MCVECLRTPCHPRCPNADDPPPFFKCCYCEEDIDDEWYYRDKNYNFFCSEACALAFYEVELFRYDEDEDYDDYDS